MANKGLSITCCERIQLVSGLGLERDRDCARQCDHDFVADLHVFEISRIGDADGLDATVRPLYGDGSFVLVNRIDSYDHLRLSAGDRSKCHAWRGTNDTLHQRCSGQ